MRAWFGGFGIAIGLTGCPSDDDSNAFGNPTGVGTTSSTGDPQITTVASTIDPGSNTNPPPDDDGDDTSSSTMAVTASTGDATDDAPSSSTGTTDPPGTSSDGDASSSDDGGTSSSSSTSGEPASSSTDAGGESSSSSSTGGACVPDGMGTYEDCLAEDGTFDTTVCEHPAATCLLNDVMNPVIGGCAIQNCSDVCDCPAHPGTGTADVVCEDVTADTIPECYLDCSAGQTCPDGMECFINLVCLFPNANSAGEPYGDCANEGFGVCGTSLCLLDGPPQTIGVCAQACDSVADCPAAPPGGTAPVQCGDVTADGFEECHIDCSGGSTCPTGMSCFGGFLCAWDVL